MVRFPISYNPINFSLCKQNPKLTLKIKCIFITFFYFTSSLVVLVINSLHVVAPTDMAGKVDAQGVIYVGSIFVAAATIPISLYLMINVSRNVRRGFAVHLLIQIMWLVISAGYIVTMSTTHLPELVQSADDKRSNAAVINTATTIIVFVSLCIFQIWFIKTLITYYIQWYKPDMIIAAFIVSRGGSDPLPEPSREQMPPPAYHEIMTDPSNILPSYEEALKNILPPSI